MRKLKLIYNPNSGDKTFKLNLDICASVLQNADYEVHLFRSQVPGDITEHIKQMPADVYDAVVVSGGDGTINLVINALLNCNIAVPIGIIPSGTANDFATFLRIPPDPVEACKIIAQGNLISSDAGKANDTYFINVCGAGLLTNISQNIDNNFKSALGKLAYYIKGLEQIPNFEAFQVRITNSTQVIIDDLYFFIVLNSSGAGGFENLSSYSEINDGKLDFIGFRQMPIIELAKMFLKVLKGDYLDDSNIIYFQDSYIKIENLSDKLNFSETDVDGESGPNMPVTITTLPNALQFFV